MAGGEAPLIQEAIRDGLRWKPENFGDGEHFDLSTEAAVRGWGDCDDLAPWLAGQLRLQGDPGAVAFTKQSGPGRYHALVRTGSGEVIDPSIWAGMKKKRGIPPAVTGNIACVGEGALAVMPHPQLAAYLARCDLPYGARHLSGYALAQTPEIAARRAAAASTIVGQAMGTLSESDVDALAYMLSGLCDDVDGDNGAEVGSFLDTIANLATTVAPIASLVPGIGPIAAAALPMAGSLLSNLSKGGNKSGVPVAPGGGFGPPPPPPPMAGGTQTIPAMTMPGGMQSLPMPGGGHVAYNPSQPGPIIVRFL